MGRYPLLTLAGEQEVGGPGPPTFPRFKPRVSEDLRGAPPHSRTFCSSSSWVPHLFLFPGLLLVSIFHPFPINRETTYQSGTSLAEMPRVTSPLCKGRDPGPASLPVSVSPSVKWVRDDSS